MYKTILTLFAFCFAPLSFAQSCEIKANALVARYTVDTHNARGEQQKLLELWRNEGVVAHRYPQTQITEAWELVNASLIKPTRYFDAHARAIEYQPGEKVHGKSETNWSFRNQLFSDELIATMTETSRTGSGCNTLITFEREDNGTRLTLIWQPALKLATSFTAESTHQSVHWTLTNTEFDKQQIEQFFAARYAYQSTDFADIGDDHTDPFLTRMVHQGFIEKGASGYYNSDGDALQGGHQH